MEKEVMTGDFENQIATIKVKFVETLKEHVSDFKKFHLQCLDNHVTAELLTTIKNKSHKLAGSASIFGFKALNDSANAIEIYLANDAKNHDINQLQGLSQKIYEEILHAIESFVTKKEVLTPKPEKKHSKLPCRILIADDDTIIQKLLFTALSQISDNIVILNDGKQLLEEVNKEIPDLIILDIEMPELNGIETLTSLKQQEETKLIPVMMLTHCTDNKNFIKGRSLGIQDYMTKPFVTEELISHVTKILHNHTIKILIADDDEFILDLLYQHFYRMGYHVIKTENGKEALHLTKKEKPDIVILDILMPEMDGFTVLQQIKSDKTISHIPIVFLSAENQHDHIVQGLGKGASDYIIKPFDIHDVSARVLGTILRNQNQNC